MKKNVNDKTIPLIPIAASPTNFSKKLTCGIALWTLLAINIHPMQLVTKRTFSTFATIATLCTDPTFCKATYWAIATSSAIKPLLALHGYRARQKERQQLHEQRMANPNESAYHSFIRYLTEQARAAQLQKVPLVSNTKEFYAGSIDNLLCIPPQAAHSLTTGYQNSETLSDQERNQYATYTGCLYHELAHLKFHDSHKRVAAKVITPFVLGLAGIILAGFDCSTIATAVFDGACIAGASNIVKNAVGHHAEYRADDAMPNDDHVLKAMTEWFQEKYRATQARSMGYRTLPTITALICSDHPPYLRRIQRLKKRITALEEQENKNIPTM